MKLYKQSFKKWRVFSQSDVQGLPQGLYFITVRPATEADRKTEVEVNN